MEGIIKLLLCIILLYPSHLYSAIPSGSPQKPLQEEIRCLSIAIHQEARGEPYKGRKAVADVIINRSLLSGDNICKVIRKPFQFSFMNGRKTLPRVEKHFWDEAEKHLLLLANGLHVDSTRGATFFFRVDHHSELTRKLKLVKVVGNHKFMVSSHKLMKEG